MVPWLKSGTRLPEFKIELQVFFRGIFCVTTFRCTSSQQKKDAVKLFRSHRVCLGAYTVASSVSMTELKTKRSSIWDLATLYDDNFDFSGEDCPFVPNGTEDKKKGEHSYLAMMLK